MPLDGFSLGGFPLSSSCPSKTVRHLKPSIDLPAASRSSLSLPRSALSAVPAMSDAEGIDPDQVSRRVGPFSLPCLLPLHSSTDEPSPVPARPKPNRPSTYSSTPFPPHRLLLPPALAAEPPLPLPMSLVMVVPPRLGKLAAAGVVIPLTTTNKHSRRRQPQPHLPMPTPTPQPITVLQRRSLPNTVARWTRGRLMRP